VSSPLRILAGSTALAHIQQHGLQADDISVMVGASGGPKWFCLYGLDQYLLSQFFKDRTQPLHLLGSSAGAWRFACYAQQDAAAASARFAKAYSEVTYPKHANMRLITQISQAIIDNVFPAQENLQQVLNHPVMKLNLIVDRARGLNNSASKMLQGSGLLLAAGANLLNRRLLRHNKAYLHNVILLCPSNDWVKSLPYGKIPDRKDFKLNDHERIRYWQKILSRSHELAAAFAEGNYTLEPL